MSKTLGFTGTRSGCRPAQHRRLQAQIGIMSLAVGIAKGVHGDCIGADAEFSSLANGAGLEVGSRPCTYETMRAFTSDKELAPPEPPMQRNRKIVADADFMIACPPNAEELKRGSGTWATIRMTRKANKPLCIIYPDGCVEYERWETESGTLCLPSSSSETTPVSSASSV